MNNNENGEKKTSPDLIIQDEFHNANEPDASCNVDEVVIEDLLIHGKCNSYKNDVKSNCRQSQLWIYHDHDAYNEQCRIVVVQKSFLKRN